MKNILFTLILISQASWACTDLSGIFFVKEGSTSGSAYRLAQTNCEKLETFMGNVINGKYADQFSIMEYVEEKRPELCSFGSGKCPSFIENNSGFKLNTNGTTNYATHGNCSYHGIHWSLDSQNNLREGLLQAECTDGFKGEAVTTYYRWK